MGNPDAAIESIEASRAAESNDPAALINLGNAYAYVGNGPQMFVDPSGLTRCQITLLEDATKDASAARVWLLVPQFSSGPTTSARPLRISATKG